MICIVMRVLDLFSGIGGFSLAFHGDPRFQTVGYCEKDDFCCRVLERNMRRGRLRKGRIHRDIRQIRKEQVQELNPQMITAGFPCQDISIANINRSGLRGERSGLFDQIMRIVDAAPGVRIVFLENSPNIRNIPGKNGIDGVIRAFKQRGFRFSHVVQSAGECGAPHRRSRWFALAVREPETIKELVVTKVQKVDWSTEPGDRLIPHNSKDTLIAKCKARCAALGNAVVPVAVIRAWNTLVTQNKQMRDCVGGIRPWNPERRLVLQLPGGVLRAMFPTPTFSMWYSYRKPSIRSSAAIGNFLFTERHSYEQAQRLNKQKKIPKLPGVHRMDEYLTFNPRFVEWMMGFPRGWTSV